VDRAPEAGSGTHRGGRLGIDGDAGTERRDDEARAGQAGRRAAALGQFTVDDEVGLWIFSGDFDGKPYSELVPVGAVGPQLDLIREEIGALVPEDGTALYATIRAAVEHLRADLDTSRINGVIVLTDGRNEDPADTDLPGLLRSLASESEDTNVRVFSIAYGPDADHTVLRQIAAASRAGAYDASDASSIDDVMSAVVSNF
jgi:Ca-activated chloride channel homolog